MKILFSLLAALTLSSPLYAEPVNPPAAQASVMSDGVVRKIDAANGKITLRHGPIVNIDMPAMTMVFRAQPPELINRVKVGDKVKFHAEEIKGSLTVTAIEVAR